MAADPSGQKPIPVQKIEAPESPSVAPQANPSAIRGTRGPLDHNSPRDDGGGFTTLATLLEVLRQRFPTALNCGSGYDDDDGPCYYDGPDPTGVGSCIRHACIRLRDSQEGLQ